MEVGIAFLDATPVTKSVSFETTGDGDSDSLPPTSEEVWAPSFKAAVRQSHGEHSSLPMTMNQIFKALWAFRDAYRLVSTRFGPIGNLGPDSGHSVSGTTQVELAATTLKMAPMRRERGHISTLAKVMSSSHVLRKLPLESREALCRVSAVMEVSQGTCVYARGETPDGIYFVLDGTIDLIMVGDKQLGPDAGAESSGVEASRSHLSTVAAGQAFGEAALIGREHRAASAQTTSESATLMYLSSTDYHTVMRAIQAEDLLAVLASDPTGRSDADISAIDAALGDVDFGFDLAKNWGKEVRAAYCRAMTIRRFQTGEVVYGMQSGVACEGVMVILDGAIEVTNRALSIPASKGRRKHADTSEVKVPVKSQLQKASIKILTIDQLSLSTKAESGSPRSFALGRRTSMAPSQDGRLDSPLDTSIDSCYGAGSYGAGLSEAHELEDEREICIAGDWFGDFAGLGDGHMQRGKGRAARVVKQASVLLLPRGEHLRVTQEMSDKETESRRVLLDRALWAQPTLGNDFLGKLIALLARRVVQQGETVAKQGAPAEELFFIEDGELGVTVDLQCSRSSTHPAASTRGDGMATPRAEAVRKTFPLANAVRLDCVGLLEALGRHGWSATYSATSRALRQTTVLAGPAHKIIALLDKVIRSPPGRLLVESKARARAEGAKGGLAMLNSQGWIPSNANGPIEHMIAPYTGFKPSDSSATVSPRKPVLAPKPQLLPAPLAPPSTTTFRFHLAEVTAIVVQESVAHQHRGPRTAVMRQIGLFAPPDPLKYSRQGTTRGSASRSARGTTSAWLSPRVASSAKLYPLLNHAGFVQGGVGALTGQGGYFEREQIGTPASPGGRQSGANRMSFGKVWGEPQPGGGGGAGSTAGSLGLPRVASTRIEVVGAPIGKVQTLPERPHGR